jgi:hypothetical protein
MVIEEEIRKIEEEEKKRKEERDAYHAKRIENLCLAVQEKKDGEKVNEHHHPLFYSKPLAS